MKFRTFLQHHPLYALAVLLGLFLLGAHLLSWQRWIRTNNCAHLQQLHDSLVTVLRLEKTFATEQPALDLFHEDFRPLILSTIENSCAEARAFSAFWDPNFWPSLPQKMITTFHSREEILPLISQQQRLCSGIRSFPDWLAWLYGSEPHFRVHLRSETNTWLAKTTRQVPAVLAQLEEDANILCLAVQNENRATNEFHFYQAKCKHAKRKTCTPQDEKKLTDWVKRETDHLVLNRHRFEEKWGAKKLARLHCMEDDRKGEVSHSDPSNPPSGDRPFSGKSP